MESRRGSGGQWAGGPGRRAALTQVSGEQGLGRADLGVTGTTEEAHCWTPARLTCVNPGDRPPASVCSERSAGDPILPTRAPGQSALDICVRGLKQRV